VKCGAGSPEGCRSVQVRVPSVCRYAAARIPAASPRAHAAAEEEKRSCAVHLTRKSAFAAERMRVYARRAQMRALNRFMSHANGINAVYGIQAARHHGACAACRARVRKRRREEKKERA